MVLTAPPPVASLCHNDELAGSIPTKAYCIPESVFFCLQPQSVVSIVRRRGRNRLSFFPSLLFDVIEGIFGQAPQIGYFQI